MELLRIYGYHLGCGHLTRRLPSLPQSKIQFLPSRANYEFSNQLREERERALAHENYEMTTLALIFVP